MFDHKEESSLEHLEHEIQGMEEQIDQKEAQLRQLFQAHKANVLDRLLTCKPAERAEYIYILNEAVRHVISVARSIGYQELIESFEHEEKTLESLRDLFESYHGAGMDNPDVRSAIHKLRAVMKEQERMIFGHSQILQEEKQRLIQILQQVQGLKQDTYRDQHLVLPRPQDNQTQYL